MVLTAIIERACDGGFTIHAPKVEGVYAPAPTEQEAKEEFVEMLQEQAEDAFDRNGVYPDWFANGEMPEIDYTYSLSGFFEAFPFINATKFGEAIGVNPSLMRRYKRGLSGVSMKQKRIIEDELKKVIDNLQAVHF